MIELQEQLANVSIFDYSNNKLCDLYDSQVTLKGQAYDIEYIQNWDGIPALNFSVPYLVDGKQNVRWDFLKSEYLVRLVTDRFTEWFVADKPVKKKSGNEISGTVSCDGIARLLKTKNIYMQFDDENGIGTISYLMNQILAGTGWSLGYCEVIKEKDGVTEKVRSLSSGGKQGALGLITTVCNLFQCRPVYHSDTKTIDIYGIKTRNMIFEAEVGRNLDALSITDNSDDIITRLYVEGEYGDHGYIGIDDVNPTGLTYIMNFDYYREIGVFTQEHETALATYLTDIGAIVAQIKANEVTISTIEDSVNDLIGQCKLTVYYASNGWVVPMYTYGDPSAAQQALVVGDKVVVLNSNGTHRYETIVTTAADLLESGDYGVAKFGTPAAGLIGAREVQIEAKEKQIASLQHKKDATMKPDKKAEYQREIDQLQTEITEIYTGDEENDGLYEMMASVMKSDGKLANLKVLYQTRNALRSEQDDIEADFILAMGNMLRDGYWQNNNYIEGQEAHLFADAQDRLDVMSRPKYTYAFDYVRMVEQYGVPIEDIEINAIVRTNDDDLDIHENLFIQKITMGIDHKDVGKIEVSNEDITLSSNDLGSLLSRMSQLADLIEQKNALYNRAEAISRSGTLYADRLNGQIDVVRNQILSSVSNWYTDDNGNIIFESVDGGSAMMLSGAGFMLADGKNEDGSWNWRTMGDGHGLTADEITAGFLSVDRIESGSIATSKVEPNFGSSLVITGNPSITGLNDQIAPEFDATQAYSKYDVVRHNGNIYMFNQDHAAGPWNANEVSQTDVSTQLEIMPDRVIQYIGRLGYSKTYIQFTDPTLDPNNDVERGDYWIVSFTENMTDVITWEYLEENETWNELKQISWGLLNGYVQMYCWNGEEWVSVYDNSEVASMYTRIETTDRKIEAEVVRANAAEGRLSTRITLTAEALETEVSRATASEQLIHTRITQTAKAIRLEAEQTYATKALMQLDSSGKITLSSTNFSHLGTSSSSGIYITPDSIKISTDGTFQLSSTYFSVATDGTITSTGGTIGGFTIGTSNIHNGVTAIDDTSHDGVYIGTDGIVLGKGKFIVTSAGNLTAKNGTFDGTVYANKLSGQITNGQISDGAVTSGKIGNDEVKTANLAVGAVTTNVLVDNCVTYGKGSGTVQGYWDKGVAAKDRLDSIEAGSAVINYLKTSNLVVRNSSQVSYYATWHDFDNGTSGKKYLGYG